jgi:hypothetical protein
LHFKLDTALIRAASPRIPAIAYCQGTLLRSEIETRNPARLVEATHAAAAEIGKRFGHGAVESKIQAHIVIAERQRTISNINMPR